MNAGIARDRVTHEALRFAHRRGAGAMLGEAVAKLRVARPVLVLGLPRGGVPVDTATVSLHALARNERLELGRALAAAFPPALWGKDRVGGNPKHLMSRSPPPLTPPHEGEGDSVVIWGERFRQLSAP